MLRQQKQRESDFFLMMYSGANVGSPGMIRVFFQSYMRSVLKEPQNPQNHMSSDQNSLVVVGWVSLKG